MFEHNINSGEWVYLILLVLAYGSFWYSSLRVFNKNTDLKMGHRYAFKILVTLTWYYSLYAYWTASERRWIGVGSILVAIALLVFWISVRHIRNISFAVIFDEKSPSHHESTGPYRWVRHPFYASYVLVYGSLIVTTPSVVLMGLSATVIFYYFFAAKAEETKFLKSTYQSQYANYMKSTGMFFPRLF